MAGNLNIIMGQGSASSKGSMVRLSVDEGQMARVQAMLQDIPGGADRAISRAANRTAKTGRALLARILSKFSSAKIDALKKRIYLHKATAGHPVAKLTLFDSPISLGSFSPRQTKTGVSVRVQGGRELLRHAFIVNRTKVKTKNGKEVSEQYKAVFRRDGDARIPHKGRYAGRILVRGPRKGKNLLRQPLYFETGPSIVDFYKHNPDQMSTALQDMHLTMAKNLEHEAAWVLSGEKSKSGGAP